MITTSLVGYAGAISLTVWLTRTQLHLRDRERTAWWASTGRDVLNFLAWACLWGAFRLLRFPMPEALVASACVLMLFSFAQDMGGTTKHAGWGMVGSFVLSLLPLLCPMELREAISWLMKCLF